MSIKLLVATAIVISVVITLPFGINNVLSTTLSALGVSPNRATAGYYTSEMVMSFVAFVLFMSHFVAGVIRRERWSDRFRLLSKPVAWLSAFMSLAFYVIFANRLRWFNMHMFDDNAFDQVTYGASVVSAITTVVLMGAVYSLLAQTEQDDMGFWDHVPTMVTLFAFASVSWLLGVGLYVEAH